MLSTDSAMPELDGSRFLISPEPTAHNNVNDVGVITHGALHDPLTVSPLAPDNKNQDWELVRIGRGEHDIYKIRPFKFSGEPEAGFSWRGDHPVLDTPITFDKSKRFMVTSASDPHRMVVRMQLIDHGFKYYLGYNPESKEVQITKSGAPLWKFTVID